MLTLLRREGDHAFRLDLADQRQILSVSNVPPPAKGETIVDIVAFSFFTKKGKAVEIWRKTCLY